MVESAKNGLVRVNFSLRGFAKIINQQTLTPFTPEPAALESFGRYLASLNLTPDSSLTFASIADFRGMDYVGYIIEKERLDPLSGTWIRLEEYRIMGAKACSYKDTRVAYGQVYRYRIRTVVKLTTANNQGNSNSTPVFQDLTTVLRQALNQSATNNATLLQRLAPAGLQSQGNSLAQRVVNLTENLKISVDSNGVPKFNYTVPAPATQVANSQATLSLQALQSALASAKPITNDVLQSHINTLQSFTAKTAASPTNSSYNSEYLVSYPSRNWQYVTTYNNTLPPWPETVQVVPSTPDKTITVYWLPPPDTQLDLSSFNVYRRNVVGDAWTMVAQGLPVASTKDQPAGIYVDTNVEQGKTYIYAVQTNNVHGYQGFLSSQIQAQLNSSFNFEQKEKDLVWVSGPGARPDEPDTIFAAFYDGNEQLIAYKNVVISPSKTFNDTDATVVLKVRSLDTQEKKDFVVRLHNKSTT